MAVSKTARASMMKKGEAGRTKPCPACTQPMIATRVIKSPGIPGGMYWVCAKDDTRMKVR